MLFIPKHPFTSAKDCGIFCEGEWEQQRQLNGYTNLVGVGLIVHISLVGCTEFIGLDGLIGCIGRNDLIGIISLVGLVGIVGLIGHNGLVGLINLVDLIDHIGRNSFVGPIGLVGLLIELIKLISLINLGSISLISLIGLIGFIGLIGLDGLVGFGLNGLIGISIILVRLGIICIDFEIGTQLSQCYTFVREGWLWCVRRVLSSLAGLDSDFENALQNAKQLFSVRIPLMTKYFVMRECDNILRGYLFLVTTVLSHQDGIYGFKFPNRFSEISCSCRDLTSLFKTLFSLLLN